MPIIKSDDINEELRTKKRKEEHERLMRAYDKIYGSNVGIGGVLFYIAISALLYYFVFP